ncbi:heptosyltransferase [Vespertiliibacter pulmonis]|uniref:ADP-heptose:LPS heptosyltransferase n=1 Tax=Vespertiliibacter pulmonis TaxID=1443036 RepID=A0A3N4VWB7_9PAST|nr:glycosyltransferase family 9 protein [Vespertiliibacter pulmonis]QLB21295.1 heptosyltransferase [Vespertiliibacter pulmonis]RPE85703.1 ADP-heptose:LPS heptosyltransferase [Vespertiliibacter pulmonis]
MKKFLQKIRLKLGKVILDHKKHHSLTEISLIRKIIFLRQDGKIGDYIISSFIFRELKKQNPNIYIAVVCSTKIQYLFRQNSFVDKIYTVKTKDIINYIQVSNKIRADKYDILIDPTVFIRNRDLLLIKLIGAKVNIGYQKQDYKIFDESINDINIHFSQVYEKILNRMEFKNINTDYDIPSNLVSQRNIEEFLEENNIHKFIAINFFGASSSRSFNDESIKILLNHITSKISTPIILLIYPTITEKVKKFILSYSNIYLYEKTQTIFDNIEIIKKSYLVISPDTSIIHIAVGLNKPIIAFYSNDNENFIHWHPKSNNTIQILRYNKNINEIKPEQLKLEWLSW